MGGWCKERYNKDEHNKLEGLHQKPDQMEETRWEGQNFSEVVAPQEEEEVVMRRSQWPRGLRRRSAAARLLRSWVWIPPGAWMFVCCECRVLSGRGLCDELITRSEEPYRMWCVVMCDLETSRMRRSWPALGRSATEKKVVIMQFGLTCFIQGLKYSRVCNDRIDVPQQDNVESCNLL